MEVTAGQWSADEARRHIELEMVAVFRAVSYWIDRLSHRSVHVLSDNTTVCAYIRRQGGTRSRTLCGLTLDLLQLTTARGIALLPRHIPGRLNVIADGLSRDTPLHTEWTLQPEVFSLLCQRFPNMEMDLFATRHTARLPVFVSPFPDPLACAVEGLAVSWADKDLYAFPPSAIVLQVIQRLALFQCVLTLIAPLQWHRPWVNALQRRLLQPPLTLPFRQDLLLQPGSNLSHHGLDSLNLHAFRLCGGTSLADGTLGQSSTAYSLLDAVPL